MKENNVNARSIKIDHIKANETTIKSEFDIYKDVSVASLDMEYIYRWGYSGYNFNDYKGYKRTHVIKQEQKEKKRYEKAPILKVSKARYLLDKKFSCKIPYSLCLDYIYEKYPNEFAVDSFGHQYTDIIVNVTCKEPYKELSINKNNEVITKVNYKKDSKGNVFNTTVDKQKTVMSKKKLRKFITNNGFILNGCEYVYYKRSGSKSRCGSVLYIKKECKELFECWSRLGIKFEAGEEIDNKIALAGILAYESLDLSHNLPNNIYIKPNQILLIDDINVMAPSNEMLVSRLVGNELVTKKEKIKENVQITDGQSLLDESIFQENEYGDFGCVLLRQKLVKSCAFNTRIIDFLKEKYGDDYQTVYTKDLLNRDIKVSDIRWIVSPSSFKFFKFYKKFKGNTEKEQKLEVYSTWLKDLNETKNKFGVCKTEQSSPFGKFNQVSYQIIQALVLSVKQLREVVKEHFEFYKAIRTDNVVFNYFKKDLQYKSSNEMIDNLCAVCDVANNTPIYRDKKNDSLSYYREKMRKGKILVKDTDYAIVVSDPVTMLYKAINQDLFVSSGYEIYCNRFDNEQMLFETRNPVVCSGNIGYVKNKYYDEYKWFNLTNNIAIITGVKNNFYTKNSGLDMDSDSILISGHDVLVQQAKFCHENFLIPCNMITQTDEDKKKKQFYTLDDISDVDTKISENYIGQVINCSQILNSIWQDTYYSLEKCRGIFGKIKNIENIKLRKRKYSQFREVYDLKKQQLEEIMLDIAACNNMSNVEIDKAKKELSVDSANELMKILKKAYIERNKKNVLKKSFNTKKYDQLTSLQLKLEKATKQKDIDKLNTEIYEIVSQTIDAISRPSFFKYTTQKSENYNYTSMKCSMDFLETILDEEFGTYPRGKNYTSVAEILNVKDEVWESADRKHIQKIKSFGAECNARIKSLKFLSKEEKTTSMTRDEIMNHFATTLKSTIKRPKILTLQFIIAKCFTDKDDIENNKIFDEDFYSMRNVMMDLLYTAYSELTLECFVSTGDGTIETLKEYEVGDDANNIIEILGKKYIKIRRKVYDNSNIVEMNAIDVEWNALTIGA
ncbi:MAG: Phage related protein [Clostridiales bacterium]|jgi:hypothetical protein|nr:Phage related protein [Clostridiales bacterium]